MSLRHLSLVFDNYEAKPAQKLVAIILADHANAEGLCWPSYRRIAERACMDERTVQRHIKHLIRLGIVTKVRTGRIIKNEDGGVQRVTNVYQFHDQVLIEKTYKLSTSGLWIKTENVHLQQDKKGHSRGGGLSTKPSLNHQSNHQAKNPVHNSRDITKLDEVLDGLIGQE